jgi:hypothetical protein
MLENAPPYATVSRLRLVGPLLPGLGSAEAFGAGPRNRGLPTARFHTAAFASLPRPQGCGGSRLAPTRLVGLASRHTARRTPAGALDVTLTGTVTVTKYSRPCRASGSRLASLAPVRGPCAVSAPACTGTWPMFSARRYVSPCLWPREGDEPRAVLGATRQLTDETVRGGIGVLTRGARCCAARRFNERSVGAGVLGPLRRPWERCEKRQCENAMEEANGFEGQLRRPRLFSGRVGVARPGEALKPWRTEAAFSSVVDPADAAGPIRRRRRDAAVADGPCLVRHVAFRRSVHQLDDQWRHRRTSSAGCVVRRASGECGVPGGQFGVPRVKTSTRQSALAPAHWVCRGGRGRRKSGARCAVRGAWCECGVPGGQCDVRRVSPSRRPVADRGLDPADCERGDSGSAKPPWKGVTEGCALYSSPGQSERAGRSPWSSGLPPRRTGGRMRTPIRHWA